VGSIDPTQIKKYIFTYLYLLKKLRFLAFDPTKKKKSKNGVNITKITIKSFLFLFKLTKKKNKVTQKIAQITSTKINPKYLISFHTSTKITNRFIKPIKKKKKLLI
jgi:hypothetical protein